ncbi:hypothetical protein [Rathayibacter toxicus]|uniref:hypothetical protein n=1 Tax=Rathayibacter toxicus TaxID=145458 RepID=UPI000CE7E19B|nr:hypothetical protein [Rathayibacter toxicus]PPI54283.1 hypothetical protein C5D35_08185 [Rathayibacter toxicus]QOD11012.1 hypothetical protein BSG36_03370 [Rathayibacter toxicus]QWL27756.1 hypothetical protein E2R33_03380 [Rathayibacter toxicus]
MELGSWAEWLSAVATIGALVAASWAAVVSRRLFGIESRRDDVATHRERQEQATRIAAWCVRRDIGDEHGRRGLAVRNVSDSPVFDLEVRSTYSTGKEQKPVELRPLTLAVLPPGDFVTFGHGQYGWNFPVERSTVTELLSPITKNPGWRVIEITFTDAHGIRWRREGGSLTEIAHAAQSV